MTASNTSSSIAEKLIEELESSPELRRKLLGVLELDKYVALEVREIVLKEFATKADLEDLWNKMKDYIDARLRELEARVEARIASLESRVAALEARVDEMNRRLDEFGKRLDFATKIILVLASGVIATLLTHIALAILKP